MPTEPELWFIESWSREAGQGSVRSASGVRLPFDASHATVDRFVLGEKVLVEIADLPSGRRVRCVAPIDLASPPDTRLKPEISVRPAGLPDRRLVEIDAAYPFDWHGLGPLDSLFASIDPQLPGYDPKSPFFFASPVGSSAEQPPPPPRLSYFLEPHGVLVSGVVARADWTRWRAAFEHLTRSIPFRRAW